MSVELRSKQQKPRVATSPRNTPDPRPVTDYSVAVSTVGGNTRLTVTLDQPCVIRVPAWGFINCTTGDTVHASSVTVVDNRTIRFDFTGLLDGSVGFVDVPYQDGQVQNFQGGYVRPGGKWFRGVL